MNNHDKSIDYMKIRTRNNSDPHGKLKVYFTCHPHDFDTYFDMICNDIFKTQDCAIYYTEDMNKPIPEVYKDTDLGSMNLFVVPITWKLLYEPNRAMESDLAFAMEHNYPILPLMMESGIEEFYTQKFGKKQYLNPYSHDITEISYEVKLKKYLATVLLDDKTIKRIQAAFDAYIFLSYRKKDRHLANELMRLIHNNPKYRDIAIWYDEYLLPGENFETIIRQALNKSDLFTLLVTPNLVNEDNYIRNVEYPEARKAKKHILAAEMVKTDKDKLKEQYEDIPSQVDAHNQDELNSSLIDALKAIAIQTNDTDPEHNYLIGLAYLEGIDVEVNISRGIELITSSAEASYLDAMETLYDIYSDGYKVSINYQEALKWAQRLTDYYSKNYGEEDEQTLVWLNNLGVAYHRLGSKEDCEKGLELLTKCYHIYCQKFGEKHPDTLFSLNTLAFLYCDLGDYQKCLELRTKCYNIRCEILGPKHPETLISFYNLAQTHNQLGNFQKALDCLTESYNLNYEVFGEKHYNTRNVVYSLAFTYSQLGDYQKALELFTKAYELNCELLGEKHPNTIMTLVGLAYAHCNLKNYQKALELLKKCYVLCDELLGNNHPKTLSILNNMASIYIDIGDYQKSLELYEKCYALRCEILGNEHPASISSLNGIACSLTYLKDYQKALEFHTKCYKLGKKVLGKKHPDTLMSLYNLAACYFSIKKYDIAFELFIKCYPMLCEVHGEKYPYLKQTLNDINRLYKILVNYYESATNYQKILELHLKYYDFICSTKDIEIVKATLEKIINNYEKLNDFENAEKYRKILKEYE